MCVDGVWSEPCATCRLLRQESARGQTARCNEMGCERHLRAAATHLVHGRNVPERVLPKMLANQHLKLLQLKSWARLHPSVDADEEAQGSSSADVKARHCDTYAPGPDSSVLLGRHGRVVSQSDADACQVEQLLRTFLSPGGGYSADDHASETGWQPQQAAEAVAAGKVEVLSRAFTSQTGVMQSLGYKRAQTR